MLPILLDKSGVTMTQITTMSLDTATEPFSLFRTWMQEAEAAEVNDANAMALATVDAAGRPTVRAVLLKGLDERGFVFYGNTESRKGTNLAARPVACANFHWKSLRRQVRIEGAVEPVTPAEADAYFATRPRGSQIGAWASQQSRPLDSRATLEARIADLERQYEGRDVPRPPHWSGYRILPDYVEFWQDGQFRLHDRITFRREGPGWVVGRLYP